LDLPDLPSLKEEFLLWLYLWLAVAHALKRNVIDDEDDYYLLVENSKRL